MPTLANNPVYEAHGVYADYDGNAPDTTYLAIFAEPEHATEFAKILNDQPTETDHYARNGVLYKLSSSVFYVEGWEHTKVWRVTKTLSYDPFRSVEGALADLASSWPTELPDGWHALG